jgi:O-antigen/teichoic acid export membrane protein
MLIQSVGFFIAGVVAAAMFRRPVPVEWAWIVCLALSTIYALAHLDLAKHGAMSSAARRLMLRTAASAHVGTWGQQLLFRADLVVLGLLGTSADLGVYSVASPIAGVIWTLSEALSLAAYGSRTALSAHEFEERRHRLTRLNMKFGAAGALVVGACSLLVPLVLHGYDEVPALVLILLPGTVIQGAGRIGLSTLVGREQTKAVLIIGLASASLAAVYVPLVWAAGAYGAALASTMIYVVQTGVVLGAIHRISSGSRGVHEGAQPASSTGAEENAT